MAEDEKFAYLERKDHAIIAVDKATGEFKFASKRTDGATLSTREVELLRLLVAGATTGDIAEALFISGHTVRNHIKSVLAKLGAHSRAEAVAIALRRRLVEITTQG